MRTSIQNNAFKKRRIENYSNNLDGSTFVHRLFIASPTDHSQWCMAHAAWVPINQVRVDTGILLETES